ncbi:MAG: dihydropteroate synthase [Cyanobacteria bacterium SIG29]|nr:dihydropteroate synthase [Cyanobacteria bacterium SIG29]
MNEIYIKKASYDIKNELQSIGFDSSYIDVAKNKYSGQIYKIFNLKPHEANILKQLCLSLGFDCAVSRETIMCNCEYTNALIFATESQLNKLKKKLLIQPFRLKQLANLIPNYKSNFIKPQIMGIVNVTPDSFSDGGLYNSVEKSFEYVKKLISDGADIIDIGGESTRPDAQTIDVDEEINRVIPLIKEIRKNGIDIPISVDTRNFKTAKLAIETGANIINDVTGLDYDSNLFEYVVNNNIPVIIMHSNKVPAVGVDFSPNIVDDVYLYLNNKINLLVNAGMNKDNIIADVGIGFGKSKEACYELLRRIDEFNSLGVKILLGISRKSFITNEFNIDFEEADKVSALYSSMLKSVHIHRVHNVALTKKYLSYASLLHEQKPL